jgi:hypothetical protein
MLLIMQLSNDRLYHHPKETKPYPHQRLCLDRQYNSKYLKLEIIKRDYIPHMPYKRKRDQKERKYQKIYSFLGKINDGSWK